MCQGAFLTAAQAGVIGDVEGACEGPICLSHTCAGGQLCLGPALAQRRGLGGPKRGHTTSSPGLSWLPEDQGGPP